MKKLLAVLAMVATVSFFVGTAYADTIFCGDQSDLQRQPFALFDYAQSFTTPNDGQDRTLDSVNLRMSEFGTHAADDKYYAVLYNASSDLPTTGLATSTGNLANDLPAFSTFASSTLTFPAGQKPTLTPNTNYSVVIVYPDGDTTGDASDEVSIRTRNASDVCSGQMAYNDRRVASVSGWTLGFDFDFSPFYFNFSIATVATAAPIPSDIILFGF